MKIKNVFLSMLAITAAFLTTSCENGDREFDDFDYQTVYFAYQNPVRTITLGEDDVYPTDLDNEHKMNVYVTLGGVWKNKQDRHVKIAVDNSLVEGKTFADGTPIVAMPENYYRLTSNEITIPSGEVMGATTVELTDAFFADPKTPSVNYVIPLKIIDAGNDSILESKNYTLYAVKFKNKYTGAWLSHGTDEIDNNGTKTTNVREPEDFRGYDIRHLTTVSLNECDYTLTTTVGTKEVSGTIRLTFDGSDNCTLTSTSENVEVTGTGKWTSKGAIKAWNEKDRDLIELNYTIKFKDGDKYKTISTKESLIMQTRENKLETFEYK